MAVLRQDLLRSTFQERQIELLSSIEKSTKSLPDNLPALLEKNTNRTINAFDDMIGRFSKSLESIVRTGFQNYATGTGRVIADSLREESENIREDQRKEADRQRREQDAYRGELFSQVTKIGSSLLRVANRFGISVDKAISESARYSDLQNIFVRNTNTTRDLAVGFRKDIMSAVESLNERSNGLYNGLESFELLVGLINTTSIKNTEFYEEYGEIFLETQKTMNLNLGTLAEFSDKFYRKYNFSSATMEQLTTSIRENTAGTSVSEDAMMNFMKTIDADVMYMADGMARRSGGNSEEYYSKIMDNMTSMYSWLHSEGYDPEYLINLITSSQTGDQSAKTTLGNLGINASDSSVAQRLYSDPVGFMVDLTTRISNLSSKDNTGTYGRTYASMTGMDFETLMLSRMNGPLTRQSYEDFMARQSSIISDNPEDEIFMSNEERIANKVSTIYDDVSDISESLGFNLETIIGLLRDISGLVISVKGLKSILGLGQGGALLSSLLKGSTTLLGGTGGLLAAAGPIALGIAAVGLSVNTISKWYDQKEAERKRTEGITTAVANEGLNGNYLVYNADGTLSAVDSWGATRQSTPNLESYAIDTAKSNASLVNKGTSAVLGLTGMDTDQIALSRDRSYEGNKYYLAAYNTAVKLNKEKGDDYALRWLEAYRKKGLMTEPWQWEWLISTDSNGGNYYPEALRLFREENKLLYPEKGFLGLSTHEKVVPAYRMGTNYVNGDQLALVHEGEAIIPAQYNPFSKNGGSTDYLSRISKFNDESLRLEETYLPYLRNLSETLTQIKDFLKFWRTDNLDRESIKSVTESARRSNSALSMVIEGTT